LTLAPKVGKVVGIVHGTLCDASCTPTEASVTGGTPHLVAPLDLTDGDPALGASLGFAGEQGRGGHVARVAGVRHISFGSLELVALGAGPAVTEPALPGSTEESATIGVAALPDELGFFFFLNKVSYS
jgi:hypothetical protein